MDGKTTDINHCWPDQIDHHKPELTNCCLKMYVKGNLTDLCSGQIRLDFILSIRLQEV